MRISPPFVYTAHALVNAEWHISLLLTWFQFVCKLESQLGQYELTTLRKMPISHARQATTGGIQSLQVAYRLIQEFASVLQLQVPFNLEVISQLTNQNEMLRYVNSLAFWAHQTRNEEVKQLVEDISWLVVRQLASSSANGNLDALNYKSLVQSTRNTLKALSENTSGTTSSTQLASNIEQALLQIFQTSEPFQQPLHSIARQDEILQILAIARPDFAKIDSAAALSPFRDVKFLTESRVTHVVGIPG